MARVRRLSNAFGCPEVLDRIEWAGLESKRRRSLQTFEGHAVDVKEGIQKARAYLTSVFSEENISEVRLEEVDFDKKDGAWLVTFGILRPSLRSRSGQFAEIMGTVPLKRSYKTVKVPTDENDVPSVKIREVAEE